MTEKEKQWVDETTIEYYSDLLARRYPESAQEGTRLAELTQDYGAETVLRVADAIDGFVTPQPTAEVLGSYVLYRFYSQIAEQSATQSTSL